MVDRIFCSEEETMKVRGFIITGTDTDVGKTLCAIHCLRQTRGTYWKPIQAGHPRDRECVEKVTGLDPSHFLKESYDLTHPLSPHEAAFQDKITISLEEILLPKKVLHPPLIIEGAGGLLVPLNPSELMADLFYRLGFPLLLVARSTLGTLNHTLMTIECARKRNLPLLGVVMAGPYMPDNEKAIASYGRVRILGRFALHDPFSQPVSLELPCTPSGIL